ncbi:polysialyltransferase family glycosyltransferase [Promicromonospora sp. NPDC050880]|uniref:polysialyltransferase family glycosyltransferase n=1 Tax=unclassified Promicromonospora TaxID=2647929 RepID=UPI0037A7A706
MTQLVVASTLFGAATAAAAADAGLLGEPDGERVLLVVNNAFAPELTPAADEIEGSAPVLARFDRVVHLTDLIAPIHPADWKPGPRERPLLERLLRNYWGLGDGQVDIVAESVWVNPAQSLARIFHNGGITVYADGLMSYGPTRNDLPLDIVQRLDGLLHLDLVPGLRPVLLSEYGVQPTVIPSEAFRKVVEEIAAKSAPTADEAQPPAAIVVGQYLAALSLVTMQEEADMHARMIRAAADAGAQVVRFKPHPSAPPGFLAPVERAAKDAGVTLEVVTDPLPVEVMLASSDVTAIVGCFSTALVTARSIFGVRSVAVDTGELLKRLKPYENSNRIPVTVVDALHRTDGAFDSPEKLQQLLDTVSYCMQPKSLSDRRAAAVAWLSQANPHDRARYIANQRLTMLGLPGAPRQNPMVKATLDTARTALRHPAMSWVDERTRRSQLRKKVVRKIRG